MFPLVQSATSLDNKIVVYSVSNSSVPSLNVFDCILKTWSGPGLVGSGTSQQVPNTATVTVVPGRSGGGFPVVPVTGGLTALVLVGLIAFWSVRRRRLRRGQENEPAADDFSSQKLEMDPRHQKNALDSPQEAPQAPLKHPVQYPPTHSGSRHTRTSSVPSRRDLISHHQPPFNPQYAPSSNPQYHEEERFGRNGPPHNPNY